MSGMYLFGLCLISVAAAGLIVAFLARFLDQRGFSAAIIRDIISGPLEDESS